MIFKLKTSSKTQEIFETIGRSQSLAPFILSKLALALSIKQERQIEDGEFKTNSSGLELNRQQVTGEYDIVFKSLIVMNEGRKLTDDEYFPSYVKAHLDRGALLLEAEFKYGKNFIEHLANLDKSI